MAGNGESAPVKSLSFFLAMHSYESYLQQM